MVTRKKDTRYTRIAETLQKIFMSETDSLGLRKHIIDLLADNTCEMIDVFSNIDLYENISRRKLYSMKVLKYYGGSFSTRICEDEGKIWIVAKDYNDGSSYWHRTPINFTNFKEAELFLDLDFILTNWIWMEDKGVNA